MFADVLPSSPLRIQLRVPQLFSVVLRRLSNTLVRVFVYIAKRYIDTQTPGARTQSYNRIHPHAHPHIPRTSSRILHQRTDKPAACVTTNKSRAHMLTGYLHQLAQAIGAQG